MLRLIGVVCVLFLPALKVLSATYTSNAGGTGSWTTPSDWQGNNDPPTTGIQNDDIFIIAGDSIVRSGSLTFNNNDYLEINGILTITGDVTVNNNLDLIVNGKLYIQGSLDVKNNAEFSVGGSGVMNVDGDVSFGQNTIGTVDGTLTVGGDFTVGGGTSSIGGTGTIDAPNSTICDDPAIDPADLSCTDANGPLPVEIIYFFAETEIQRIKLTWATSTEENFDFFTVERASDGKNFQELARIHSKFANSSTQKTYQFLDEMPLKGYSYYRLKATDIDGFTEYHGVISVKMNDISSQLKVFPNPSDGIEVKVNFSGEKKVRYKLVSFTGKELKSGIIQTGVNTLQFRNQLDPGIYFIFIRGDLNTEPLKIVVR